MFASTTIGSFPRSNSLIEAINNHEHEIFTAPQLEAEYARCTREAIQVQESIDTPTDGQLRWDDILTPFAYEIEGMKVGGLIRFYDNNFYYRKPEATGKLSPPKQPVAAECYEKAKTINANVKPVIPGPYTFACLSTNSFYKKKQEFVFALADILASEAKALGQAGAEIIQIDEPSLVFTKISKDDLELARQAINTIAEATSAKLFLATYFGSANKILSRLLDFKVEIIGLDCTIPANVKALEEIDFTKKVCLGMLDARTTKMDSKKKIVAQIKKASKKIDSEKILVSPSAGLGFLPEIKAIEKINLLGEIVKELKSES